MKVFKKSTLLVFFIITFFSSLFAENYIIKSVTYKIVGKTREHALKNTVPIDTKKQFKSEKEFTDYLANILQQLKNQRVLETVSITPSYNQVNSELIEVDLLITAKDTLNIIVLPYPKYDSNSGFTLKVKLKDYNFFGSMLPLDSEIVYKATEDNKHNLGFLLSFNIPFKLWVFNTKWNNNISLDYTIGNKAPNFGFTTGLDFNYPISNSIGLNFGFSQGINYNPTYKDDGDAFYFTEKANIGLPFTLAKTNQFGNFIWTPTTAITYYWDINGIKTKDLHSPQISVGHSLSFGKVNWIGNFRNGFYFSASNTFDKNLHKQEDSFHVVANIKFESFKAFKYVGIANKIEFIQQFGKRSDFGAKIRGVRDTMINSDSIMIINSDLPIKVWQTDWVGYGLWDWTRYIDFELQISPFFDIAIGNNYLAGSSYKIKDGWYGAGLEIIGFPNKMRSVQGRVSVGIDVVRFAEKVGNKINFVNKVVNKLFNTGWRTGPWYEISIGIGLFY